MPEISPLQIAVYAVALVAVAVLGARWLGGGDAPAPGGPPPRIAVDDGGGARVTVHVAGAVRRAGVYRVPAGARVEDAVKRAGGATRRADPSALNLAARLEDGRQVVVPARAPRTAAAASGGSAVAGVAPAGPVSLGSATVEQLDTLPGIGPATAAAIVEYRDANGGFGSIDELDQVPGIGPGRLAELRDAVAP